MPGATATTTTTTATATMPNLLESYHNTKIETHTCSLCDSKFANFAEQRSHFKAEWHVYNLHRKMDAQLPISETEFKVSLGRTLIRRKVREHDWNEGSNTRFVRLEKVRHATPTSESSDDGVSLEYDDDLGEDDGEEESSEAETSDDSRENETDAANVAITWKDGDEMKLSSGKVLGTKRHTRKHLHRQPVSPISDDEVAAEPAGQPQPRSQSLTVAYLASTSYSFHLSHQDRRLARRDNMGIIGLSDPERKALLATEKKMIGLELRARGGWEASVESKGNCQKHYRIGGSRGGKKMAGLERRLG